MVQPDISGEPKFTSSLVTGNIHVNFTSEVISLKIKTCNEKERGPKEEPYYARFTFYNFSNL